MRAGITMPGCAPSTPAVHEPCVLVTCPWSSSLVSSPKHPEHGLVLAGHRDLVVLGLALIVAVEDPMRADRQWIHPVVDDGHEVGGVDVRFVRRAARYGDHRCAGGVRFVSPGLRTTAAAARGEPGNERGDERGDESLRLRHAVIVRDRG
jgi:hypothetical protein